MQRRHEEEKLEKERKKQAKKKKSKTESEVSDPEGENLTETEKVGQKKSKIPVKTSNLPKEGEGNQ